MTDSVPSPWQFGVSDFSTSEPLQNGELIKASGLDFIEPGLAKAAAMPEGEFLAAAERLRAAEVPVLSANWFLPPTLKVVGPEVDEKKSREFLELALSRADHLGAKAVVFGSPGSRSIPVGWAELEAREQMVRFCRLASEVIQDGGWELRIAVEHVNHTETNFLNTFAEALAITREIDRPEIGLAADFYHFAMEGESTDVMREAADLICAVQLADPRGRVFPKRGLEIPGVIPFFEQLAGIGYRGGISVEATVGADLADDCDSAARFFREDLILNL
ncbi:MAG: sugar phosphate isomerase/epimerase [Akkermansiaceae bacterium]|jgi:D-psicose/D-tagatose/L-ribulose 3-epimerase